MSDFDVKEKRFEEDIESYLCTEGGYTTYTCSACDDSYVADHVDPKGHSVTG